MTKVIFRKDKDNGTVIAFLPEVTVNHGNVMCYEHNGQHGEASIDYYMSTIKATLDEYATLYNELTAIGYNDLKVMQKLQRSDLEMIAWNRD